MGTIRKTCYIVKEKGNITGVIFSPSGYSKYYKNDYRYNLQDAIVHAKELKKKISDYRKPRGRNLSTRVELEIIRITTHVQEKIVQVI